MKPLQLTPIAHATPAQLKLAGGEPGPWDIDQTVLVQWSAVPEGIFRMRCPEAIVSLSDPSETFLIVRGQRWQADGPNGWKFDVPFQVTRYWSGDLHTPYPARLRGWISAAEEYVDLRFQFVNQSDQTLGGKCKNPCTDLSLGLEALEAGASAEVRARAWFLEGDLEDLKARLNNSRE